MRSGRLVPCLPKPEVFVTVHDNRGTLPETLASLDATADRLGPVTVLDSGSTDGTADWLRRHRPKIRVRSFRNNPGPCVTRNFALRRSTTPTVLLLDGDVSLASGCLFALLQDTRRRPDAALWTPRIVYSGDPQRIYYDAGEAHWLGLLCLQNAHRPIERAEKPSRQPGAVSTTVLLIRRAAVIAAGLFDESYRFYGEDLELSLRLRSRGLLLRHVPEALAFHHKPLPEETRPSPGERDLHRLRHRLQTANRWRTLLKVCRARTLLRTLPLQVVYEAILLLLSAREGGLRDHLRGFCDLGRDLPRLLRARRDFQKRRIMEDEALFSCAPLTWRPAVRSVRGAETLRRGLDRACAALWPRDGR